MDRWTDQFVGDRMTVDREFSERIVASEFSNQEWGTIMTAVTFEITDPEDPETATLVADTSDIEHIMPAVADIDQPAMGQPTQQQSDEGLLGRLTSKLGLGSAREEDHTERIEHAEALAEEYATVFQEHLEAEGKWEQACTVAAQAE